MSQPSQKTQKAPFCRACLAPVSQKIGEKDGFDLLRCDQCGTTVVDPFPTLDDLIKHYAEYQKTPTYLKKKDKKIRRVRRRIKRMVKTHKTAKTLLDIGCSVGYSAPAADGFNLNVTGIDLDGEAIDIANEHFGQYGAFQAITAEDYAASGAKSDMIYAVEVIEHVPNPETFVEAISEILNEDGILYVTAPDGGHPLVPKDFSSWDMVCPPEHLTYFTRKGLETIMARYGLEKVGYQLCIKPGIKGIFRKVRKA